MTWTVVKIGGAMIDAANTLQAFLQDFVKLPAPKILVHGGGKMATNLADRMGVEVEMVDGRRITNEAMLEIVTMVYGGKINKSIVAKLQAMGCNALGLSGADANVILAEKRKLGEINFGYAGDILEVNVEILQRLAASGLTPVLAPLTHDGKGKMLNTNADTIAASVAVTLGNARLIYAFDKPGVLRSVDDPTSIVHSLDRELYDNWKSGKLIANGMIPKLDTGFSALESGVAKVWLCHANDILEPQKGTELC